MRKRTLFLFFLAVGMLYCLALGTVPLLEPDEGRYAEIPREMLASGDFVTPRLNGVAYLEKPPLYYWGTAGSLRMVGETEVGARGFTAAVSVAGGPLRGLNLHPGNLQRRIIPVRMLKYMGGDR